MGSGQTNYRAYLLRLWRVRDVTAGSHGSIWRASLEEPSTGERLAFATLERLFAFLADQTNSTGDSDDFTVRKETDL